MVRLDTDYTFFNFSNAPWVPQHDPQFGEWCPPGETFSSCVANVQWLIPDSMVRPKMLTLQSCATALNGSMDILMYASDADESGPYPWVMKSFTPLVIASIANVSRHHTWLDAPQSSIDALMEMRQPYGIRFGVACRSPDGADIKWYSARMKAYT